MVTPLFYAEYRPAPMGTIIAAFTAKYGAPPTQTWVYKHMVIAGPIPATDAKSDLWIEPDPARYDAIGNVMATHTTRKGKGRIARL